MAKSSLFLEITLFVYNTLRHFLMAKMPRPISLFINVIVLLSRTPHYNSRNLPEAPQKYSRKALKYGSKEINQMRTQIKP